MSLENLIVMEQFLHCLPEDLCVWLRERKPESPQQAASLADDYVLVRREGRSMPRKPPVDCKEVVGHDRRGGAPPHRGSQRSRMEAWIWARAKQM